MSRRNRNRRAGFTLMEVLLVIAILLALGTVSVVGYSKIRANSQISTTRLLVDQVTTAVKNYNRVVGVWPGDDEGIGALVTRPDDEARAKLWEQEGPYIEGGKVPVDAWQKPLNYKRMDDSSANQTGVYFHVWSCGPNQTDDSGSGDDIPAWADESR